MGERIASEEARVWIHQTCVVLLVEAVNWKMFLLQVTPLPTPISAP